MRSNLIVKQEEDGLRIEYGGKEKEDTRKIAKCSFAKRKQSENKENEKITANQKKTIDYSVPAKYKLKWVPEGYKKRLKTAMRKIYTGII